MAPPESLVKACEATCTELKTATDTWQALNGKDLVAFNAILAKNKMKPIAARVTVPQKVAQRESGKGAQ